MKRKIVISVELMFLAAAVSLVPALKIYNYWRQAIFREGYVRGIAHGEAFHYCFPLDSGLPPKAWQDEAWRFVNSDPKDCSFVVAADNYAYNKAHGLGRGGEKK